MNLNRFKIVGLLFIVQLLLGNPIKLLSQKETNLSKDTLVSFGTDYYSKVNIYQNSAEVNLEFLRKAMSYFEQAESWEDYVNCMNYCSTIYYYEERFDDFYFVVLNAVEYASKYLDPDNQGYNLALGNLGLYYLEIGDYEQAVSLLEEAIKKKKNTETIAKLYINLGHAYLTKGDYDEAILQFRKAKEFALLVEQDKLLLDVSYIHSLIGKCFIEKNEFYLSKKEYQSSIDILNKTKESNDYSHQIKYNTLLGLARVFISESNYEAALKNIKQAEAIQRKFTLFNDYEAVLLWGEVLVKKSQFDQALEKYNSAYNSIIKESGVKYNQDQVSKVLIKISKFHQKIGDYEKALEVCQQSLNLISSSKFTDYYSNPKNTDYIYPFQAYHVLEYKGDLFYDYFVKESGNQKDLEHSLICYKQAILLLQNIRQSFIEENSKINISKEAVPLIANAVNVVYQLYEKTGDEKYIEEAFSIIEKNKSNILLESINQAIAKGQGLIPDSLVLIEQKTRLEIAFYSKKINSLASNPNEGNEDKLNLWKKNLLKLKQESKDLENFFERNYPKYFTLKYQDQSVAIDKIREKINSQNASLIEYFVGQNNIYFLTLQNDKTSFSKSNYSDLSLAEIKQFTEIVNNPPSRKNAQSDYENFVELGFKIYNHLVAGSLNDQDKNLIVIPDGILSFLPFEVLLTKASSNQNVSYSILDLEYLIEKAVVSYNYSAAFMDHKTNNKEEANTSTFYASAPSFPKNNYANTRDCNENDLSNLRCNLNEVNQINELFAGITNTGINATKSNFEDSAPNFKILHLATHACLDQDDPSNNKIFFADDYVSSQDLYNLQLNAELVVLSACNTGSGKMLAGDGVMSLAKGFVHAGCPSSVTSLWAVDDCTTSEIMFEFYKKIKENQPKDFSLSQSKISYLNNADKLHSHPYFWAPFVQFGNTDPVSLQSSAMGFKSLLLLSLVLLGLYFFARRFVFKK